MRLTTDFRSNHAQIPFPAPDELSHNQAMYFSPEDERWINRKAREIARRTGDPLPIAKAEAMREFKWMQRKPKA